MTTTRDGGAQLPRLYRDIDAAIRTAFEHTAPGGVALFQPDFVRETFEERTELAA